MQQPCGYKGSVVETASAFHLPIFLFVLCPSYTCYLRFLFLFKRQVTSLPQRRKTLKTLKIEH